METKGKFVIPIVKHCHGIRNRSFILTAYLLVILFSPKIAMEKKLFLRVGYTVRGYVGCRRRLRQELL